MSNCHTCKVQCVLNIFTIYFFLQINAYDNLVAAQNANAGAVYRRKK